MQDIRIDGRGNLSGGEYGKVSVDGMGKCEGNLTAERLHIDGMFKCNGNVQTKQFDCNGVTTLEKELQADRVNIDGKFKCGGRFKAGELDCDGMATAQSDVSLKSAKINGHFSVQDGNLEAEEIDCDGMLKVEGQVSADKVTVDGIIRAHELVGDTVRIRSRMGKLSKMIMGGTSKIELLEATNIELEGVQANTVNGSHVVIKKGCEIEHLDCNGTLFISDQAVVKHITGEYTRTDG